MKNMFKVTSVSYDSTYIKVEGEYMIPEASPFEREDILTEDKYTGHQIMVSFSVKNDTGNLGLILDTRSMHPKVVNSMTEIKVGTILYPID